MFSDDKNLFLDSEKTIFSLGPIIFIVLLKKKHCKKKDLMRKKMFCHYIKKIFLDIRNHFCWRSKRLVVAAKLIVVAAKRYVKQNGYLLLIHRNWQSVSLEAFVGGRLWECSSE